MQKKNFLNIALFILLILVDLYICFDYYNYFYKSDNNVFTSYYGDNTKTSDKMLAYYLETGVSTGVYEESGNTTFPSSSNYKYNSTKSTCEKGSTLTYNSSTNQVSVSTNKTERCLLYFDVIPVLYSSVLTNNGGTTAIANKGIPSFSSTSTSNDGMYAATDSYGTSYYFRGAVDNNWVYFAGIYWRIIRINGDNTVRMIYSGTTAPTSSTASYMSGTGTQINATTYSFNDTYSSAEYNGYKYTVGSQHGFDNDSTAKSTVDSWYSSNLTSYADYLADSVFCVDRSVYTDSSGSTAGTGTGTTTQYFGAYVRNRTNKSPILTCPNQSDAFTVSDTTHGNAHLTYPIGLITADEVAMAGAVYSSNNNYFYLRTNQEYWTLTPYYFSSSAYNFTTENTGSFDYERTSNGRAIRPVINIKSTIKCTGNGTYSDPYNLVS